jgi:hypothetical protein
METTSKKKLIKTSKSLKGLSVKIKKSKRRTSSFIIEKLLKNLVRK